MNSRQFQPPYGAHYTVKLHNYGGWQTWITSIRSCGCCVVAFVVFI